MDIRPFEIGDEAAVVALWHLCGLTRPWNDPYKDIARKLAVNPELFLVATRDQCVVGTVMAGYDGHRGWLNYLAVAPNCRRTGLGRQLVRRAEDLLRLRGCPKVNLQVRTDNTDVTAFYRAIGYNVDDVVSLGRRLEEDTVRVRRETPADISAIRDLVQRAFEGLAYSDGTEHEIVDVLRGRGVLTVSLVAEASDVVIGHIAFSPARPADGSPGWYTLGPVAVTPSAQRRGIGGQLITTGLASLRALDAHGCVVLGSVDYYRRFGFCPTPDLAPPNAPKDHFMVLSFDSTLPMGPIGFDAAFGET